MHKDAEAIPIVAAVTLKTKATFDWADFYLKLKYWLEYKGYGDELKNFKEERYIERNTNRGKTYEIKWKGEKFLGDYFSYIIEIEFKVNGLEDVEVVQDGQKLKLNKASVEVKISSLFVKNRSGKWGKDSMMKNIYEKFIVPQRMEAMMIKLYVDTYKLVNEAKAMLNMSQLQAS